MLQRYKLSIYSLLVAAAMSSQAVAADVEVTASLDSARMLMGNRVPLTVSVSAPEGVRTVFPLLSEGQGRPFIPLLNDTIELSKDVKVDTVRNRAAGRQMVSYRFMLQAFDSGYYRLPPFVVLADGDSVLSDRLALTVLPVKVTADDKIDDFTHVAGPFKDTIPEGSTGDRSWLARYWWLLLLTVASLAFVVWAWRRYRREGTLLPQKKEVPPYEAAIGSLRKLKERHLWENGREKDYYTALTRILRVYMSRRFGVQAMEMTSSQIMKALKADDSLREYRSLLRPVLDLADFVKFAKVRPLADDNVMAFDNVLSFVERTRPEPEPDGGAENGNDGKKGGGK